MLVDSYVKKDVFLTQLSAKIAGIGVGLEKLDGMSYMRNGVCIG
jgi:hypothetical protein